MAVWQALNAKIMIPDPAENIPAHCLRNSCRLKNGSKGYAPRGAVHFHALTAGMQNQAKNAETIALGARWFVVHTLSPYSPKNAARPGGAVSGTPAIQARRPIKSRSSPRFVRIITPAIFSLIRP